MTTSLKKQKKWQIEMIYDVILMVKASPGLVNVFHKHSTERKEEAEKEKARLQKLYGNMGIVEIEKRR